MDLLSLQWDDELCRYADFIVFNLSFFGISKETLPQIRSSAEIFGYMQDGPLKGIPISGVRTCSLQ